MSKAKDNTIPSVRIIDARWETQQTRAQRERNGLLIAFGGVFLLVAALIYLGSSSGLNFLQVTVEYLALAVIVIGLIHRQGIGLKTAAVLLVIGIAINTWVIPLLISNTPTTSNLPTPEGKVSSVSQILNLTDVPKLGSSNAPVNLIIFGDFQDQSSETVNERAYSTIISNYVNTGIVRLYWVDLPYPIQDLPFHNARLSNLTALKGRCVYRIAGDEAFWKWHDYIYAHFNLLKTTYAPDLTSFFNSSAISIGIDVEKFNDVCNVNNPYQPEVDLEISEAHALGINSPPHFLIVSSKGIQWIQNQPYIGSPSLNDFEKAIQSAQ
ncbi:MAG: thioredoxin domain-containing protein [Candidatus Micrarchaeia archaeon]